MKSSNNRLSETLEIEKWNWLLMSRIYVPLFPFCLARITSSRILNSTNIVRLCAYFQNLFLIDCLLNHNLFHSHFRCFFLLCHSRKKYYVKLMVCSCAVFTVQRIGWLKKCERWMIIQLSESSECFFYFFPSNSIFRQQNISVLVFFVSQYGRLNLNLKLNPKTVH